MRSAPESTNFNDLTGDVKKLKGSQRKYRLRVGDYRVLFELQSNRVIYDVGDRKDIYTTVHESFVRLRKFSGGKTDQRLGVGATSRQQGGDDSPTTGGHDIAMSARHFAN